MQKDHLLLKLENREDIKNWLDGQPREVSTAIASRSAMRVFPIIGRAFHDREKKPSELRSTIVLPILRAIAISWVAAKYPTHNIALIKNALIVVNAAAKANAALATANATAIAAAAKAAAAAAVADANGVAVIALANAVAVDVFAVVADANAFYKALSADADILDKGGSVSDIIDLPLWLGQVPQWFEDNWQQLQSQLSSADATDENWQVWTNWFNARIIGTPAIEKLELARATIDDEIWKQGPKVVNAHIQALIDKFTPKLKQNPLGNSWKETGTSFTINTNGDETDVAAAADPVTQQLHESVRQKALKFADKCKGIDDKIGWSDFEDAVQQFVNAIDIETAEVPDTIAIVYDTTITLASFLEQDNDLRKAPVGNMGPLDADMRRMFVDVVRTVAPWVRRFPTARELDDETGKFLTNKDLFEPSRSIITAAGETGLISQDDRELITGLLAALERVGLPAQKAGNRGFLSARNLVIVAASFFSGAIASNYSGKSELIDKAGSFLARNEKAVTEIISELPADIQATFKEMYQDWPLK